MNADRGAEARPLNSEPAECIYSPKARASAATKPSTRNNPPAKPRGDAVRADRPQAVSSTTMPTRWQKLAATACRSCCTRTLGTSPPIGVLAGQARERPAEAMWSAPCPAPSRQGSLEGAEIFRTTGSEPNRFPGAS